MNMNNTMTWFWNCFSNYWPLIALVAILAAWVISRFRVPPAVRWDDDLNMFNAGTGHLLAYIVEEEVQDENRSYYTVTSWYNRGEGFSGYYDNAEWFDTVNDAVRFAEDFCR